MYSKSYYVYIVSNQRRTVLYIGITNNLRRRLGEHISAISKRSFTARYNANELLYYETHTTPRDAIKREKELKGWTRKRKIALIKKLNPEMKSLQTKEVSVTARDPSSS